MPLISNEDAKRLGADLKHWANRPIRATNSKAVGLCGAAAVMMMFIATQQASDPATAVRGMATMFAVLQSCLHFMATGLLRGLAWGGIAEAQQALKSVRDPRRISNLDMAALWALIALVAQQFQ